MAYQTFTDDLKTVYDISQYGTIFIENIFNCRIDDSYYRCDPNGYGDQGYIDENESVFFRISEKTEKISWLNPFISLNGIGSDEKKSGYIKQYNYKDTFSCLFKFDIFSTSDSTGEIYFGFSNREGFLKDFNDNYLSLIMGKIKCEDNNFKLSIVNQYGNTFNETESYITLNYDTIYYIQFSKKYNTFSSHDFKISVFNSSEEFIDSISINFNHNISFEGFYYKNSYFYYFMYPHDTNLSDKKVNGWFLEHTFFPVSEYNFKKSTYYGELQNAVNAWETAYNINNTNWTYSNNDPSSNAVFTSVLELRGALDNLHDNLASPYWPHETWATDISYDLSSAGEKDNLNRISYNSNSIISSFIDVYDDGYIAGNIPELTDFFYKFSFKYTSEIGNPIYMITPLITLSKNYVGGVFSLCYNNIAFVSVILYNSTSDSRPKIGIVRSDGNYYYGSVYLSYNTTYYVKFFRNINIGPFGRYFIYIYSDSNYNNLIDGVTIYGSEVSNFEDLRFDVFSAVNGMNGHCFIRPVNIYNVQHSVSNPNNFQSYTLENLRTVMNNLQISHCYLCDSGDYLSSCSCDGSCNSDTCSCDGVCNGDTCSCNGTCNGDICSNCYSSCYSYLKSCSLCDHSCYNDTCICNGICNSDSCSCNGTCNGDTCSCDVEGGCSTDSCDCDGSCNGDSCSCNIGCNSDGCDCNASCNGDACSNCYSSCYSYDGKNCYLCNMSCYSDVCTCNGICNSDSCSCDGSCNSDTCSCYSEESCIQCNATVYRYPWS